MVLGGALLTKSPAIFFAVLLPGTALLISPPRRSAFLPAQAGAHLRGVLVASLKLLGLGLVVYVFAVGIYNILRLGPNFQMISLRNKDYVFPLNHLLLNPFDPLQFHLKEIWEWFGVMLTWPIFSVSLFGILRGLRKYRRETVLLLIWLVLPLLIQAEYAKVFTARYILFSVPIILIFGALGMFEIFTHRYMIRKKWLILISSLFLFWAVRFDFYLLTDPKRAHLPKRERSGYLEEWTSGYGIKEVADYLREKSKTQKILVGTEGYFGTLPDGLQIYLEKIPNITIIGVGYPITKIPEPLENSLKDNNVYLVVNDSRLNLTEPELQRMKLINSYPKAVKPDGTQEKLMFYEIPRGNFRVP